MVLKKSMTGKLHLPTLAGHWQYLLGVGVGTVEQLGARVVMKLSWLPDHTPGPHYEMHGVLKQRLGTQLWSMTGSWRHCLEASRSGVFRFRAEYDRGLDEIRMLHIEDPNSEFMLALRLTRVAIGAEAHVIRLRDGVSAWNEWRLANLEISPRLGDAVLTDTNLAGVNFSSASLYRAALHRADLRGCSLRHANLRGTSLARANLQGADLSGADLTGAELSHANLDAAVLAGAIFDGTKLKSSNFAGAHLCHTVFSNTSLNSARNLSKAVYLGGNVVDTRTMCRSLRAPTAFFRGCGVPSRLIEELPSVCGGDGHQSCFISYASKDSRFVLALWSELRSDGVDAYVFSEIARAGQSIEKKLRHEIRTRDIFVLVLSGATPSSDWVKAELAFALRSGYLKQARLQVLEVDRDWRKSRRPWLRRVRTIDAIDFSAWGDSVEYHQAYDRLMRNLQRPAEEQSPS